jgi:eukaryotic-like serine/threonine-protein kinase
VDQLGEYQPVATEPRSVARGNDPTELLGIASWRLGQFRVIKRLGRGASASVWLATPFFNDEKARKVALKVFALQRRDAKVLADGTIGPGGRVVEEASMLSLVSHPNVVNFYNLEWDPEKSLLGLVMEFIDGQTLADKLIPAPLPIAEVLKVGSAIAGALTEIDRLGLVHRDVKPANIIQSGNTYKLLDFGIAANRSHGNVTTFEGIPIETSEGSSPSGIGLFGTVGYIDPEHYDKGHEPDHLSDIYSLGATLYEALTGVRPATAAGGLDADVLRGGAQAPTLTARGLAVPKPLASLIARMLQPQPKLRPAHARVVQAECEAIARFLQNRAACVAVESSAPFKGMSPYASDDAQVFFWRDNEVATAVRLLANAPVLLVQGRTGVGKTSFVCAGVMPQIQRGALGPFPQRWHTCGLRAISGVVDQIFHELQLKRMDPADLLETLVVQAGDRHLGYTLFLDDADGIAELPAVDREWLIQLVQEVVEFPQSCFRLILGVNEAVGLPSSLLRGLASHTLPLTPIPPAAWSVIIERSVAAYGYEFESDSLRKAVIEEAQRRPLSAALTQFALQELWDQRDQERKLITQESWSMSGGFAGAVARHANRSLERLASEIPDGERLGRGILVELVAADGGRANLTREELLRAWPGSERVIDALIVARLIKEVGARIRIVHQMLIDDWLALADWVDANRGNAMFVRSLAGAAALFAETRGVGVLWRGSQLRRACSLPRQKLAQEQLNFIDESVARSHQRGLRRLVTAVLAGAVVVLLAGMLVRWVRSNRTAAHSEVSVIQAGDPNTPEKVREVFANLTKEDKREALRLIREELAVLQQGVATNAPAASPVSSSASISAPVAPHQNVPKPHVSPASAAVPGAVAPPPQLSPAPPSPQAGVPQQIESIAKGCMEPGRSPGSRALNVIVRGDGTISWTRFEGAFTQGETACVTSALSRKTFPSRAGDVTLARVGF